MSYVDGYVLVIPKKNLKKYKKMAKEAGDIWVKHGALRYLESIGDDLKPEWCKLPFPKLTKCKPSELIVFAFVLYRSRAHRDKVNAKVMKEMMGDNKDCIDDDMPFDVKRMAYAGFESIVDVS